MAKRIDAARIASAIEQVRLRVAAARAGLLEHKLQLLRRDVLPRAAVEAERIERIQLVRAGLLGLADRVAGDVGGLLPAGQLVLVRGAIEQAALDLLREFAGEAEAERHDERRVDRP